MSRLFPVAVLVLFSAAGLPAQTTQNDSPKPDNTQVNRQDQTKGAITADQQGLSSSDQQITKDIRSKVIEDKTLSTYAHNVKIITLNGKVTLKGPVRTDEEKTTIAAIAGKVAGADKVTNEIEIAPKTN